MIEEKDKILFITGSLNQGGAENQLIHLAKLFHDKGHSVELLALTDHEFYKSFLEDNSISYSCLNNKNSRFKRVFLCSKQIKKFKPTVIISYLRLPSQVALFAKLIALHKAKLIVGERTSLILPKYDLYYFNLMRCANGIISNSYPKLKYIFHKFPHLKNKSFFLPNLFDTGMFVPAHNNFENKPVRLTYLGRLSPEKNVISLIKAINILIKNQHDIILNIYGDDRNARYFFELKQIIDELNLNNKVFLRGKTSNVLSVYHNSDLVCLLSNYEGFSNVLSEAISCGVPVLASNIEENKFLIEDGLNGFLVNSTDISAIAHGIEKFLKLTPNDKMKISLNNRSKAEAIFDNERIYLKYLELFKLL